MDRPRPCREAEAFHGTADSRGGAQVGSVPKTEVVVTAGAHNVFVNCPFDDDYLPSFEALIFTVMASGYDVRCALEENDSGEIRFDKLCRLIEASDRSVHDLSRVELNPSGLPRFNMPFELGLFMGARRFGGKRQKTKSVLVMVTEPYRLPVYRSDLAGNDPVSHHGKPEEVIRIVRRYLHARPDGTPLPGAARIIEKFAAFKAALPALAAGLEITTEEIDPYREYRIYLWLLAEFLRLP
jgi:hypothetical protein